MGFRGQTWGEDWCWLLGDRLKELECATATTGARSQAHHRNEAPLSGARTGEGVLPLQPLSPCASPCPRRLWESTPQPPHLGQLPPGQSCRPQMPPRQAPRPTAASGADTSSLPAFRGRAKSTAEPQGPHNLESRAEN